MHIHKTFIIIVCTVTDKRRVFRGVHDTHHWWTGLILRWNSASRLLCGEKPATILPPTHDHVLIQSVHEEKGLFTDSSLLTCVWEGEAERGAKKGPAITFTVHSSTVKSDISSKNDNMWLSVLILWQAATNKSMYGKHWTCQVGHFTI